MAIGVVSDEEFDDEIESLSLNPIDDARFIPSKKPGRQNGDVGVPAPLRKVIGDEATNKGHKAGKELAEQFGISNSSVTAYEDGKVSLAVDENYNTPAQTDLQTHINRTRSRIADSARKKLELAIDSITAEKLASANPRIASGVARDLSSVVKENEPLGGDDTGNRVVFIVPQMRDEKSFAVIDVKE